MLIARFSQRKETATRLDQPKSPGKAHSRVFVKVEGSNQEIPIRVLSKGVFSNILHWLGIRKRAFLQVKNENGNLDKVTVSAESLRKRIPDVVSKKVFYKELEKNKGVFTSFVEKKLKSDKGNPEAQYNLGRCYRDGKGVKQDYTKAAQYYKLAADQGYAPAQHTLGLCYEKGFGVEKDEKKAFEYTKLAADQGLADSQYYLGVCYEWGRGVDKDPKKAVDLYKLAVDQGHLDAIYRLACCYQDGVGVEKDALKASELFSSISSF